MRLVAGGSRFGSDQRKRGSSRWKRRRGLAMSAEPRPQVSGRMKFGLIDRIVELARGERIVAVKAVSLAEEYLADHFPTFPVLPGVLMLEGMAEAAAWLVRDARDFRETVILLRRARNVT